MPVYNVQDYVAECVESLINQTFSDLEIILVDNGSTDASSDIIQGYANNDDRIKIIKLEKNQGLPRARNIGLDAATGEFIAFVDSDDACDLTMYEKLYQQAQRFDADVVTCNVLRFENDWRKGYDHHPEAWYCETDKVMPITSCPEQFMEQAAWAKLLRSAYIRTLPYRFTEGSVCCEDVPACTYLYLSTNRIAIVNEALYFYRNRPTSLSNKMNKQYTHDFVWAMQRQDEIIAQKNFHDDFTLGFIVEMRFLLANHILSKMRKDDIPDYFKNMNKVLQSKDQKYLEHFFDVFPHTKLLFDGILHSDVSVYKKLKRMGAF